MYLDLQVEIRGDLVAPKKDDDVNEMLDGFVTEFSEFLTSKYPSLEIKITEEDRDDGSED